MNYPLVGVLHIGELAADMLDNIKENALHDLHALQTGGVHAVLFENDFESSPSPYGEFLTTEQRAWFHEVMEYLIPHVVVPFGFCVLLNDFRTAFDFAKEFRGSFVRIDTFVDDVQRISDKIEIHPKPAEIMAYKPQGVELWADVHVKHTVLLQTKTLEESIKQAQQAGADKIIITAGWTGEAPAVSELQSLHTRFPDIDFVVGSGITTENLHAFLPYIQSCIVGSSLKVGGRVNTARVQQLTAKLCG